MRLTQGIATTRKPQGPVRHSHGGGDEEGEEDKEAELEIELFLVTRKRGLPRQGHAVHELDSPAEAEAMRRRDRALVSRRKVKPAWVGVGTCVPPLPSLIK